MKDKYSIRIYWSDEYKCFFASVPELKILIDGATRKKALMEAEILIGEYVEIIAEDGEPIPEIITWEGRDEKEYS